MKQKSSISSTTIRNDKMWWKLCTGLALFRMKTLFSTVVHMSALASILMLTVIKQHILVFNSFNYFYWVFDCWKCGSIRFCIGRERSIMSCLQPLLHIIIVPVRKYTVWSVSSWTCTNASKCVIVCACTCHMHSHCKQHVISGPSFLVNSISCQQPITCLNWIRMF